ncbi:MAG: SDR family oxidoreductase [Legionella sp.]|nr:SDR family oxidoreductase [Legionella sp.]
MPSKHFSLDNEVVFIAGATGHLGEAISLGIADMGAMVILCGRTLVKLTALAEKIKANGGNAHIECCDLTEVNACRDMMQRITTQFSRLDGIVNCAHSGRAGTIDSAELSDFVLAQQVHVNAPFFLMKEGLELLKKSAKTKIGGSSIVNIASMYGHVSPDPGIYGESGSNNPPYYGAAKAGLIQLTRYMACHLGEYNIRVNSISPGAFPPERIKQSNPDFYQSLCKKNPLGRIGMPSELVGPVLFLLSGASSFVTGTNLCVDGGWTSW